MTQDQPGSAHDPRFDPRVRRPAEDPPWTSGEQVAPDEDEVPWDRPADMPWPEPDPDFGRWYDEPYAVETEAEQTDQPDPQTADLPAFQRSAPAQMAEAQPVATDMPATTVAATTDQWQSPPAPRMPVSPPFAEPTPPPYAATATPTFRMPMPEPNVMQASGNGHGWEAPVGRDDPYDEFAPLADDLTVAEPMESVAMPTWGQQPTEPTEPASGPVVDAEPAPAAPSAHRESGSVFGDFFAPPAPTPVRAAPSVTAAAPALAAPAPAPAAPAPAPAPTVQLTTPPQPTPAVEPPTYARAAVDHPFDGAMPSRTVEPAAMNAVDDWQPPTVEANSRQWPSVGQAPLPWSVQAAQPLPRRPAPAARLAPAQLASPTAPTARPPVTFGADAMQPAGRPQGQPTLRMAPTPPLPPRIAPLPALQATSVAQAPQPVQSTAAQPLPAWRARTPASPQSPATSPADSQFGQAAPARMVVPPQRAPEMPATGTPVPPVQAAPVAPARPMTPTPAPATQSMTRPSAMPAQPTTSVQPVPAVRPPASTPADPTRASLAATASPDDLWFLAPQQTDASTADVDEDEENPSTISTLFWTVLVGLLVVALVLAFLQFLTGVFR